MFLLVSAELHQFILDEDLALHLQMYTWKLLILAFWKSY